MKDKLVLEDLSKEPDTRRAGMKLLPKAIILISMVMLAVASGKYYLEPVEGFVDELFAMITPSLIIAVISYLVWRHEFKKKGVGLLAFSIMFFGVSFYRCVNMEEEVYVAKHTAKTVYAATDTAEQTRAFEKEFKAILKDIVENNKVEPKIYDRKTFGKLTHTLQALNSCKVQLQKDMVAMAEEMEGPGTISLVTSLVGPETSKSLKLIKEGKAKLAIHRSVYEKYTVLLKQRQEKAMKEALLPGGTEAEFGNVLGVSHAEVFEILTSLIDETTSYLDFLESKQGEYTAFWKMMFFNSQEDLDTFNNHKKEIIRIEAKFWSEQARIKDLAKQYTKKLEEIEITPK